MFNFFKNLRQKWANWSGDRELEHAIRRHLSANGHYGGTAKLQNVRLAAVQRPGWLQVYRFDAIARAIATSASPSVDDEQEDESDMQPAKYATLYGLVREDIRHDITTIRTFDNTAERSELFVQWSEDLIQLRSGRALM
jgi:hypothetical protein